MELEWEEEGKGLGPYNHSGSDWLGAAGSLSNLQVNANLEKEKEKK